mmetsp:Transcript_72692/g.229728  ORF Transcript_72692/g.229728 Transcript_72692/m.229728 type:complete len:421 (+) Transcript_72692:117-1379(+)
MRRRGVAERSRSRRVLAPLSVLSGSVHSSALADATPLDQALLVHLGNGSVKSLRVREGEDATRLFRRLAVGYGLCSDQALWTDPLCVSTWRSVTSAFHGLLSKLFQKGLKLQAEEQASAAIATFEQLIRVAPGLALPHVALGSLQLNLGDLASAEESLRRGLHLDSTGGWEWLFNYSRFWGALAPRQFGMRPTGVLHIGAHEARESVLYALQGIHQVIWVEANPRVTEALQRNAGRFGHTVHSAMCWNTSGELRSFHLASRRHSRDLFTWSSVFRLGGLARAVGVVPEGTVTVSTQSGRDILAAYAAAQQERSQRWEAPDYLVLDIHGAEYQCLRGFGADGLQGFRYVFVELSASEVFVGQHRACEVHDLLTGYGFDCKLNCGRCEDLAHYDSFYIRRESQVPSVEIDAASLSRMALGLS